VQTNWADPESTWQVKLRRAQRHLRELEQTVTAYRDTEPWSVLKEPGRSPDETSYRLKINRPVPSEISAIAGDLVHNLRSGLDSIAYALAEEHLGRTLEGKEVRVPAFPICLSQGDFDKFFGDKRRRDLYGPTQVEAMACVQPFALVDEAVAMGVRVQDTAETVYAFDDLGRLERLWNLDKHRRLAVAMWFPTLTYWSHEGAQWLPEEKPDGYADGALLGYMKWTEDADRSIGQIYHEMDVVLVDDIGRNSVVDTMTSMLHHFAGWVFPRIFHMASGATTRPMGFSFASPVPD
jgi:hypothetical protein